MQPPQGRAVELAPQGAFTVEANRVFYRGGFLLDTFRGRPDPSDTTEPEDWVASTTAAWTPPGAPEATLGLSPVPTQAGRTWLRDAVRDHPVDYVGSELAAVLPPGSSGLLVKLLDAAIRLPVHAHPTRAFARRVLGSAYGKTEAWLILGTRQLPGEPAPGIYLGWRQPMDPHRLRRSIDHGGADLLDAMNQHTVAPGDTWLVPAGMPHAIGAGVFLAELQEPTDFSIVAERQGFPLDASDGHLGRGWDVMLRALDLAQTDGEDLEALRGPDLGPADQRHGRASVRSLLPVAADPFFRADEVRLHGPSPWPFPQQLTVAIVVDGNGRANTSAGSVDLRRGVTFVMRAGAASTASLETTDTLGLIACRPPDPRTLRLDLHAAATA